MDYQKVSLVGLTIPILDKHSLGLEDEKEMCSNDLITYCARVSNPSNQASFDTGEKLLKYMIDQHHWSPFEMVNVVMEIETTRDIARQILRHRSFSFQEFSQRYAKVELMPVKREARTQDHKNRQNSIETDDPLLQDEFYISQMMVYNTAIEEYNRALKMGIAKEQARCLLPEGLTMTRMYMNGSLRSWITFINLREKNGTQKEHIDIAKKCKKIIIDNFPFLSHIKENENGEWEL